MQNNYYNLPPIPPAHNKAVASLVLGIIGICCCGVCSIVSLIFALQAKSAGNTEGIRTAGFILSIIGIVLWCFGIVITMATGILDAILNGYYY